MDFDSPSLASAALKQTLNDPSHHEDQPPEILWRLEIQDIWRFLTRQPISYWLICFYLFIEYVRPQSVYPAIDVVPWGQLAILGCLAAVLIEGKFPWLRTPLAKLYVVFVLVLLASSVAAVRPGESWRMIELPLSWFLVFLLITRTVTNERRWLVFFLSFLLYNLKMSQHGFRTWAGIGFGFQDWGATGGPGWFHNSGEFGIQMCMFFPLSVSFILALRPYWDRWRLIFFWAMPVTAIASIIGSSSRGALVGWGLVMIWMIGKSKYRIRGLVYGSILAVTVFLLIPQEQMDRFRSAGDDATSVARLTLWENGIEIASQNPVLGIGYNNWLSYHQNRYGRTLLSHNIFIEAVSELGFIGLATFLALIAASFWVNLGTRRMMRPIGERGRFIHELAHGLDGALIGYLASGFFVTVLHYPYFWINLAMIASLRIAATTTAREARNVPVFAAKRYPIASSGLPHFSSPLRQR